MKPALLLSFLLRGYSLKSGPSGPPVSLYNLSGEIEADIPPEVIADLLSNGLIAVSREEPELIYILTEKARMLLSMAG